MVRMVRRLVFLLWAKFLRRRIVLLLRRWLARRARRAGSSLARVALRRGVRGVARGSARLLAAALSGVCDRVKR